MKDLRPFASHLKFAQRSAAAAAMQARRNSAITQLNDNNSQPLSKEDDSNKYAYLRRMAAENLADRLTDTTRTFESALLLGSDADLLDELKDKVPSLKNLHVADPLPLSSSFQKGNASPLKVHHFSPSLDFTNICPSPSIPPQSLDLVVSNLFLHWVNDLPAVLKQARDALKPDGAFLACMFAGDTLYELRTSMQMAEQEREGGVAPHVSPMLRVADACGLLQGAGLGLVTVDAATVVVDFDSAFSLMRHLWHMGESNAVRLKRARISRQTMMACAASYQRLYGSPDGTIPATFEMAFVIGWAPSPTQAKPLQPGLIPEVSLAELGKGYGG